LAVYNRNARWLALNVPAEQIASTLAAQLNQPVVDATGLKAKYDVDLRWVPEQAVRASAAAGPGGPLPGAPELEAGPTLFSAIQEQLGLKLQARKATVEVVVIDHAEKVPTEN
jgi:uncharacterized protein (TIGR03435 family)